MDKIAKLSYDAFRAASNNKDANGVMKEYEELDEGNKKAWQLVASVIEENTRLDLAKKQIEESISNRIKQLKEQ